MNRDNILTHIFNEETRENFRTKHHGMHFQYSLWAQQVYLLNNIIRAEVDKPYEVNS